VSRLSERCRTAVVIPPRANTRVEWTSNQSPSAFGSGSGIRTVCNGILQPLVL